MVLHRPEVSEVDQSERLIRRIELVAASLLFVFTVAALIWFSWRSATGVLLGGCIVIVSLQVLKWQIRRALQNPEKLPTKAGPFAFGIYFVRFLGTLLLVFLVLYLGLANPFAFLVGLSVVVLSIILVGVFEFITMKKGES